MTFGGLAVILILASSAAAEPTLSYEGSFHVPNPGNPSFYDAYTIVVVPDGHPRPGSATPVSGPTVVMGHRQGANAGAYELQVPALVSSGPLNSATLVPGGSGGTQMPGMPSPYGPTCMGSAGNFWQAKPNVGNWGDTDGLRSAPDDGDVGTVDYTLGSSGTPTIGFPEGDWLAGDQWDQDGVLRRGDGSGNNLPVTDGTKDGATFLVNVDGRNSATSAQLIQCVRSGDGGPMSTQTPLFRATKSSATWQAGNFKIDYIRDTAGDEWFALALPVSQTPWDGTNHHFNLDFYRGDLSDDLLHAPDFTEDIGPMVDAGAGWRHTTQTKVTDFAVDWATSQIYVIDTWTDSRIHVFTLEGEASGPIPEPGGLALLGLVALGLRRKRS
jgi:MYXO-CTERM domain-containing protein